MINKFLNKTILAIEKWLVGEYINIENQGELLCYATNNNLTGCYRNKNKTFYFKDGLLHRENGPAIMSSLQDEYYLNGLPHNDNGPAVVGNDFFVYKVYGQIHRINGYAYENKNEADYHFNSSIISCEKNYKNIINVLSSVSVGSVISAKLYDDSDDDDTKTHYLMVLEIDKKYLLHKYIDVKTNIIYDSKKEMNVLVFDNDDSEIKLCI